MLVAIVAAGVIAAVVIYSTSAIGSDVRNMEYVVKKQTVQIGSSESTSGMTLPVNVTQQVSLTEPTDHFTLLELVPTWESERIDRVFSIAAPNGRIIVPAESYATSAIGVFERVDCGSEGSKEVSLPLPERIPLANITSGELIVNYSTYGLKPSSDGNYNLKFAALHETSVALPSGASIIYDHSTVCAEKNSPSRIYIYDITFKLG